MFDGTAWVGRDGHQLTDGAAFRPEDGWHTYRLEVDGTVVTFSVDNARLATVTDNRYLTGGGTGIFCKGYQLEVETFRTLRLH